MLSHSPAGMVLMRGPSVEHVDRKWQSSAIFHPIHAHSVLAVYDLHKGTNTHAHVDVTDRTPHTYIHTHAHATQKHTVQYNIKAYCVYCTY